jgi:hypothetical protein
MYSRGMEPNMFIAVEPNVNLMFRQGGKYFFYVLTLYLVDWPVVVLVYDAAPRSNLQRI